MASATITVTFTVERPFPNFAIGAGPFYLGCLRTHISSVAMRETWRGLFVALQLGRRVWYYCSMPDGHLEAEGDYCIIRRFFAPR